MCAELSFEWHGTGIMETKYAYTILVVNPCVRRNVRGIEREMECEYSIGPVLKSEY